MGQGLTEYIYEFAFEQAEPIRFTVETDAQAKRRRYEADSLPLWTQLAFHQCACCPLDPAKVTHCPAAVDIAAVTTTFQDMVSYTHTHVRVITAERVYSKSCDAQSGLNSLLGLIMANSDCPILCEFKPMAHFHLPFSSVDETIYRVASTYLLKQYFNLQEGESADFALDGLEALYYQLQQVNCDLVARIRFASRADANLNAITTFFSLATIVTLTLKQKLTEIQPLFFVNRQLAEQAD